jgi:hypothetical protein
MNDKDERFLARWSRRKLESKDHGPAKETTAEPQEAPQSGARDRGSGAPDRSERQPTERLTEADFADVDFEALNMESDYSRFLAPNVPDSIKYKALRKLWHSDASFTQIDPFQDYTQDFTDAACAVPAGALKTAYRVGKGFLSNEEIADWEKLGVPETRTAAGAPEPGRASDASASEAKTAALRQVATAAEDLDETRAPSPAQQAEDAPCADAPVLDPDANSLDDDGAA